MVRVGKQTKTGIQAEAKPVLKSSPATTQEIRKLKKKRVKKSSVSGPQSTAEQPKKSDVPKTTPAPKEIGQKKSEKKNVKPQKLEAKSAPAPKADHQASNDQKKTAGNNQANGPKEGSAPQKEKSSYVVLLWKWVPELTVDDLQKKFPNAKNIKVFSEFKNCNIRFRSLEEAEAVVKQKEIEINGRTFPVKLVGVPGRKEQNKRTVLLLKLVKGVSVADLQKVFPKAEDFKVVNEGKACSIRFHSVEEAQAVANQNEIKVKSHTFPVKMLVPPEDEEAVVRWKRTMYLTSIPADLRGHHVQKKFPNATSVILDFATKTFFVVFPTVEEMMEVAKSGEVEINYQKVPVKYYTERPQKRPHASSSQPSEDEPKAKRVKADSKSQE